MYDKKQSTCTKCGNVEKPETEMFYSQGDLVCPKCKEENRESDKRAFDRDMRYSRI